MWPMLVWIGLSVVIGYAAAQRGRSGPGWFFISILLSPLIAGIALLATGPLKSPNNPKINRKCPYCAEYVSREAVKCKHCGSDLEPEPYIAPALAPKRPPAILWVIVAAVLIILIASDLSR